MTTTKDTPLSEIFSVSDLEWTELRPGLRAKNIWEDADTERKAVLIRFEPGAQIPLHRHAGDELIYIVEGAVSDESGTVTAGNMSYRPNGCVHTVTSRNGATVLAVITGGIEPATEIGDAPRSQIMTLSGLEWVDARPGVRQKRIWEDPSAERRVVLSRFEPGATLPLHRHVGDELIFVIEGESTDQAGTVTPGNLNHRPNGCVHSVSTRNGATVLAYVWGRTEPV